MPLHIRLRGKVWHARGTVRIGREIVRVGEFSTGQGARADAQAIAEAEADRIRRERLEGSAGRARRLTIAECLVAYLERPGGVREYDQARVADFSERIGDRLFGDAALAWSEWLAARGARMAPATANRWRAILQAALGAGARANGLTPPRLPTTREPPRERVAYLTIAEQDRLLASYNRFVRPVVTVLCFAGLRTSEALRLDWRHVDLRRGTLFVASSKSGRGRTVPMHDRVLAELEPLWRAWRSPEAGPVFISQRREPYRDTRSIGGNPLAKAHKTACRRAGIEGFRVHDWRHHWASRMVMSGCDLFTLMRLGGWSTPRMVQRYASVSIEHLAEAVRRMA